MKKVTLELSEKEFTALAELITATSLRGYRKARGENIIIAANVEFTTDTFKMIQKLDRKLIG